MANSALGLVMVKVKELFKNGVFASDDALVKLVCLAYRNIRKKWTMSLANWSLIAQQVCIWFGDRSVLPRNQTADDDTA